MANCYGNKKLPRRTAKGTLNHVLKQGPNEDGLYRLPIVRKGKVVSYALVTYEELMEMRDATFHQCPEDGSDSMMRLAAGSMPPKNPEGSATKYRRTGSHKKAPSKEVLEAIQIDRRNEIRPYGFMDDWLNRVITYELEDNPFSVILLV